jgi:tetratricopeptide (TPR) repeat protein
MQLALRLPAAQAAGWLDRAAAAIPADAQDERTGLAEAWHTLGTIAHDAKATAKADAIYADLLARPDVKAGAALSRGIAAEQEKDLATAEAAYRRALALEPDSVVAQNNLAMVLLKKDGGDVAEAARLAKAAVEKNPRAATLHDTLAQAQARGKDVDGAAASLRKALELEPGSLEWRVHLARVYLDGGRRSEADKVMREIATLPAGPTPPSEQTQKQLDQLRAEMSKQTAASVGGG